MCLQIYFYIFFFFFFLRQKENKSWPLKSIKNKVEKGCNSKILNPAVKQNVEI